MKTLDIARNLETWHTATERIISAHPDAKKIFAARARQAVAFSLPFLQSTIGDLSDKRVLEVGCGFGAKSLALSPFVKEYLGVDLVESQIHRATEFGRLIGSKAKFQTLSADSVGPLVREWQPDIVVLYAVIEHLTPDERVTLFSDLWANLPATSFIYVGEAPNRLNMIDYHSSQLPYFSMIPPWLAEQTYTFSRRRQWINRVNKEENVWLGLHRRGQSVSAYDFLNFFGGSFEELNRHVIGDSFSVHKLNWKSWKLSNTHFIEEFNYLADTSSELHNYALHPTFALSMINFVLSRQPVNKKGSVARAHFEAPSGEDVIKRDGLGNRMADLTRGWNFKPEFSHPQVYLGVAKHHLKSHIQQFDSKAERWLDVDVSHYSDSYLECCDNHVFVPLKPAETYKLRSKNRCHVVGAVFYQPAVGEVDPPT